MWSLRPGTSPASEARTLRNGAISQARAVRHTADAALDPFRNGTAVELAGPDAGPTPSLQLDESPALSTQIELSMLMETSGLALTPDQLTAFAEVTSTFQEIRNRYEASIARTTAAEPGSARIEIPLYSAAGDKLRERYFASLAEKLGTGLAASLRTALGAELERMFAGFGVSAQELEFNAPLEHPNAVVVTRTALYWMDDGVAPRLARRQETHLLSIEDPSGQEWGALALHLVRNGQARM